MAEIPWTRLKGFAIYSVTLTGTDESEALETEFRHDCSVQMTGTFGNAVALKAANHPTNPQWVTAKDASGNDLSFTANSPPTQILPGAFAFKAIPAAAVTSVVITVILKR